MNPRNRRPLRRGTSRTARRKSPFLAQSARARPRAPRIRRKRRRKTGQPSDGVSAPRDHGSLLATVNQPPGPDQPLFRPGASSLLPPFPHVHGWRLGKTKTESAKTLPSLIPSSSPPPSPFPAFPIPPAAILHEPPSRAFITAPLPAFLISRFPAFPIPHFAAGPSGHAFNTANARFAAG